MAYSVDRIVPVTSKFVPGGLAYANFGSSTLFAPESEAPVGFNPDTFRDYNSVTGLADDGWLTSSETYKAASKWFGSTPSPGALRVYVQDATDASYVDTLNKARNVFWWFISLFTIDLYDDSADVLLVAEWCNDNESMYPNPTNEAGVLTGGSSTAKDISSAGYRFAYSTYHDTDRYAAFPLMAFFAAVNYSVPNSTITGQYKVATNVTPIDLNETETNFATADDTKCGFWTNIDLQGQVSPNRYVNSVSHSALDERIADVFDSSAFINAVKVDIFNVVANQPTKLKQTPVGQQAIITATQGVCEQFIENGYLGPRNYIDPDDGLEKFTRGYEILTKPEDILDLTDAERANREAAPMVVRIFRAGAIWIAPVDLTIY